MSNLLLSLFAPRRGPAVTVLLAVSMLLAGAAGCNKSVVNANLPPLSIDNFAATQAAITTGQSTTLVWSVTGAVKLSLTGGGENTFVPVSSTSVTISPAATTTYTLTATDPQGNTASATTTVTVSAPPAIDSFTATPTAITDGQTSTLSWVVSDSVATITIDNGVGTVTGNSISVQPTNSTTYTMTAANLAGAVVTAQATVNVVLAPKIVSFIATPSEIGAGQNSTLGWSVIGATNLSIDNGIGAVSGSSIQVSPASTTTYTLTASNVGSSLTATSKASTRVTVSTNPPPSIASFTAAPPSVGPGGQSALNAVFTPSSAGVTATIDHGVGTVQSGVPVATGPLPQSTTFTLTVTSADGTATARTRVLAGKLALLAGAPTSAGYQDGTGKLARFAQPQGLTVAPSGNLFVVDSGNACIRQVTPGGNVTTFVGDPQTPGSIDGNGLIAQFNQPYGVVADSAGNLWITDAGNSTIRAVTPSGQVTTFAGMVGMPGQLDGLGILAQFGSPEGIVMDSSGNLFVVDSLNCNIREIAPSGQVSTFAGPLVTGYCSYQDGQGSQARFNAPSGLAIDANANLYVADQNNQVIRKVTPQGLVTTLAGSPGQRGYADGQGSAARFRYPTGIAVDPEGNLLVTDALNYVVRRITPEGLVTTVVGKAGASDPIVTGGPLPSNIPSPVQIAIDPATGNQYFTLSVHAIASAPF
ncbi:MAG: hypothetical protein WCE75_09925 [Terracidiphilus sp.]